LAQQQSLLSRPFDAVDRCAARIDAGRAKEVVVVEVEDVVAVPAWQRLGSPGA
jgi:hypothetical protein